MTDPVARRMSSSAGSALGSVEGFTGGLRPPSMSEDRITKAIEQYTAAIPSSAYLAVALVAIGVSLAAQVSGQYRWGNFIAQWVPTWLLFGLYNKLVKLEGHDRQDRVTKSEFVDRPSHETLP
jgi:hypothetical protein